MCNGGRFLVIGPKFVCTN